MADGGGTLDTEELGEAFDFMGVENWDVDGLMNIVENNGRGEVRCISTYPSQPVNRHQLKRTRGVEPPGRRTG
jgi:hypothetical protein